MNMSRIVSLALLVAAFQIVGSAHATAVTLEGYWALEETSIASPAVDGSGNGNNGTYSATGVTPGVTGAPGFGLGADFTATNGLINLGAGTGFGNYGNDFSVVAWIKLGNTTGKHSFLGAGSWGVRSSGTSLQITTFGVKDYLSTPGVLSAGDWAHVAVVLDSNNDASFYVNGNIINTDSHNLPANASAASSFLGSLGGAGEAFAPSILDEVGVFKGSLTLEQIRNTMNFGVELYNGIPAPEPSSFLLLGLGALGLVRQSRRRNA